MTAAAHPLAAKKKVPWTACLLAGAGFLLAVGYCAVASSQQIAAEKARGYLRAHYKTNLEVPVKDIRPDFVFEPSSGKPAPPLGFCWTIVVDAGVASGEVQVNPWNHEVVDWNVDL